MNYEHLGLNGLSQMPNLHPVWVHFPIALLPLALVLYIVGISKSKKGLCQAGIITLSLASIAAALALWTGRRAGESIPHGGAIHSLMETHSTLGWAILIGVVLLTAWSFFTNEGAPKAPYAFLIALILLNLTVLQQADLGGRLVYVEGAGVKPVMATMKDSEHSHGGSQGHHQESENGQNRSESKETPSASPTVSPSPESASSDDHSGHDHDH